MKETTTNSLIVARSLFERAEGLCVAEDRFLASTGLVMLQDALEIIIYAVLIEKDIDETKNLESKSFDELIGELKKADVSVPKSGTLKALNKQRVLTKHYAQMAEPATVRNYLNAARIAVEAILKDTIGKSLGEIYLSDLLEEGKTKKFLLNSEKLIEQGSYLGALIEIRKAIYVQFEEPYSIYGWREHEGESRITGMLGYIRGGMKAPAGKRNKKWITENVDDPLDYIQIDYETWRLDAMEWGINTAELQNLRRLTPDVFRPDDKDTWYIKHSMEFPTIAATLENAKYCLDHAISVILKKQDYERVARHPGGESQFTLPDIYLGDRVFAKASTDSAVVHTIQKDYSYYSSGVVTGFDGIQKFVHLFGSKKGNTLNAMGALPSEMFFGYLPVRSSEALTN